MPSRAAGPWVVALDADPGETTGSIRLAAPVESDEAERALAFAAEESEEIRWEGLVPKGALVRRAGRLVLTERSLRPAPDAVRSAFLLVLQQRGSAFLPWNVQSKRLLDRMRFYAGARPDLGAGDLTDAGLTERAAEWLVPHLKLAGGHVINAGGLFSALRTLASSMGGRIDDDVPESVTLPTGGRRAIDYEGSEPSVEARIQEVFGLARSPVICGVPLTFRLLSPASRPLQITRDLESFWKVTYAEVRKEMRGRYPKHYWPEDPRTAQATSRVRPKD
jgi:ATP-dependent helicase HrpB